MYKINFDKPSHVHFIGIGGISMSGLAAILLKEGFVVSGSDSHESELTDRLQAAGARIAYQQAAENITDGIDVVVYTAAIHPSNPEYAAAVAKKIPLLTRAQLLGQMMKNYKIPICVSGTHGKTTTTSMAAHILMAADMDPTISVGGILPLIKGNYRIGSNNTFLMEACEYTNSFLSFFPKISIILDIDADHLDFFKDLDDIRHSFRKFAELLPDDGVLIINADDPACKMITKGLTCKIITYSMSNKGEYTADLVTYDKRGNASFRALYKGNPIGNFSLQVPGQHNVSNALAAIALARELGIDAATIENGFESFHGTNRRFEYKGKMKCGATVIDDYAHHPTEIKATLHTAERVPHETIWCVFQPHTYTRTKALLPQFAEALSIADHVVLADIYAARELDIYGVSSRDLQAEIQKLGTDCDYFPSFEEIEDFLRANVKDGDLVITMGAGNIVQVGEDLID
ncbi:UDP-N-acetylmuramate--L-alanine ligase [Bilifractor sp. HCP3S3_D3]|uniref:UDP-N-acetylmuramate--L-alanine ligase n=1 Tax=unclassified Bilifractor TaxID=2815795 RepID=UPI002A8DAD40|nr:UDP-N-acetylmuramate--L-alanine ligase [Eubacterium sp.]MDY5112658.1 UDP-N-acetylmuramate--L-alanine ligase [Bilifractor sp.]